MSNPKVSPRAIQTKRSLFAVGPKDPVAYRMRLFGDIHPRQKAALQLAVDQSGYGKKQLPTGRAWGVGLRRGRPKSAI